MDKKNTVVIVEDHTILREGLRALLLTDPTLEVIEEAEDGIQAIRLVQEKTPDVVLLDLSLPKMDGLSAMREIKRLCPEIKILALTVHKAEEYILESFKAGANGYCLKDATQTELLNAIKSVLAGKSYISPGISDKVLEGFLDERKTIKSKSTWDTITPREREILKLIGEGYKNKEIADYLCISVKTVEKHRANLMNKLDLHSSPELTAYAAERGLVTKE